MRGFAAHVKHHVSWIVQGPHNAFEACSAGEVADTGKSTSDAKRTALRMRIREIAQTRVLPSQPGYCWNTNGGPLTRFPLRSTFTSTWSAIFMKGMPLFIP